MSFTTLSLSHSNGTSLKFVGFSPRGVTPTSKFVWVLPFPHGDAKKHKDLFWFGQEKALRPAGEKCLYYSAPKCLYRGEYKRGVNGDGVSLLHYVWLESCVVSTPRPPLL